MPRADFLRELESLGYQAVDKGNGYIVFDYLVEVGRFAGTTIQLGFIVDDTFPLNPPSGPHMCPALLPVHPGSDLPHPAGGVHESPFTSAVGGRWQYWSRPFTGWGQTEKTARTYMAFIRQLFATQ